MHQCIMNTFSQRQLISDLIWQIPPLSHMIDLTRVSCRVLVEMVVDEMASNIRNKQEKNHAPCL